MDESDDQLVNDVLAGNRSAYGVLYDRHARLVRAICFDLTRDLDQARDLTQDVFLRAYSRLARLRQRDRFASWIAGIARFICKEWRRKRLRERHLFVADVPERIPEMRQEGDPLIECLRHAISELPDRERLALHLFYLQGESIEHVQNTLNLSRSGAYKCLERARRLVAAIMQRKQESLK